MKTFAEILEEIETTFYNWVDLSDKDINFIYENYYVSNPSLIRLTKNVFPNVAIFKQAVWDSKTITVSPDLDDIILGRKRKKPVQEICDDFHLNNPMRRPILLRMPNGEHRLMYGNSIMDAGFSKGIYPQVILIDLDEIKENEYDRNGT